jgi:hypothetical protein
MLKKKSRKHSKIRYFGKGTEVGVENLRKISL